MLKIFKLRGQILRNKQCWKVEDGACFNSSCNYSEDCSFSGTGIAEGLIQKGPESISKNRRKISDKQ